uniref:Uncharacterized protein n=1 Tax=Arion vulgaris TaxID=1028688 RepID=A0A0B7BMX8_9EUPU
MNMPNSINPDLKAKTVSSSFFVNYSNAETVCIYTYVTFKYKQKDFTCENHPLTILFIYGYL